MAHNNERGQILTEALIGILTITTLLFIILNQLQIVQKRTKSYGISKETKFTFEEQRSKK